jgi:hypothetical protein
MFSAVIMIIAGVMRVLDAVWCFRYSGTPVDHLHQALFGQSLNTYGWVWLIVGVILIAAGFLVMGVTTLAADVSRLIGVLAAGVTAITAVTWLPYYPVWSLIYIGLSVVVIYGLLRHWAEQAEHG